MINISNHKTRAQALREQAAGIDNMGIKAVLLKQAQDLEKVAKDEVARQTKVNTDELFAKYNQPVEVEVEPVKTTRAKKDKE